MFTTVLGGGVGVGGSGGWIGWCSGTGMPRWPNLVTFRLIFVVLKTMLFCLTFYIGTLC